MINCSVAAGCSVTSVARATLVHKCLLAALASAGQHMKSPWAFHVQHGADQLSLHTGWLSSLQELCLSHGPSTVQQDDRYCSAHTDNTSRHCRLPTWRVGRVCRGTPVDGMQTALSSKVCPEVLLTFYRFTKPCQGFTPYACPLPDLPYRCAAKAPVSSERDLLQRHGVHVAAVGVLEHVQQGCLVWSSADQQHSQLFCKSASRGAQREGQHAQRCRCSVFA